MAVQTTAPPRRLPEHAGPARPGRLGMSLVEACREQERLAFRAPAKALAVSMRHVSPICAWERWNRQPDRREVGGVFVPWRALEGGI
jgi:hypothetical protein